MGQAGVSAKGIFRVDYVPCAYFEQLALLLSSRALVVRTMAWT